MNSFWIDFGIWLSRRGSFKIRFLFYSEVAPVARSSGSTGDDFESFDWRTEFRKIHAELSKQINYKNHESQSFCAVDQKSIELFPGQSAAVPETVIQKYESSL